MEIDFSAITEYQRYKLMASLIVPRPIALITTLSEGGVVNAAPFSMFNMLGEEPPIVMVSMDGRPPMHASRASPHWGAMQRPGGAGSAHSRISPCAKPSQHWSEIPAARFAMNSGMAVAGARRSEVKEGGRPSRTGGHERRQAPAAAIPRTGEKRRE
jgi:hypothetical protein